MNLFYIDVKVGF